MSGTTDSLMTKTVHTDQLFRHLHPGRGGLPRAHRRGAAGPRGESDGRRPAIQDDCGSALQVHVGRRDIRDLRPRPAARCEGDEEGAKPCRASEFFSKGQACLRASELGKRFGWGVHADAEGRVAIYAVDSKRYQALARDPDIKQVRAMRTKRA